MNSEDWIIFVDDHIECKICGAKVDRGIISVSSHWAECQGKEKMDELSKKLNLMSTQTDTSPVLMMKLAINGLRLLDIDTNIVDRLEKRFDTVLEYYRDLLSSAISSDRDKLGLAIRGYAIGLDTRNNQQYIECLTCHMKSYNENDIKYKYCGKCHKFH